MSLGKRIKAARIRLDPKPTQKDIGDEFGISDKAVSAWERDDTIPELERMPKLARLLAVPLVWLLEGAGDPPAPDDLAVIIDALPPADKAMLRAMIEALHKERGRVA